MKYIKIIITSFFLFYFSYSYSYNKINYLDPVPNAKFVSINNSIIIGFEKPVRLRENDLRNCLLVNGSVSGLHEGSIIICDESKFIYRPTTPFYAGELVNVKLIGKLLGILDNKQTVYSFSFTTSSIKIPWDPLKSFKDEIDNGIKIYKNTDSVQVLPALTVTINNNPALGDIFISNFQRNQYQPFLIITDKNGLPYWYSQLSADCEDFKEQPNGHLTRYDVRLYINYEMDGNYNVINSYQCGNGYTTDGHEFRLLNSGYSYVMAYDPETVDMSHYITGGDTNATVVGLIIQELDPNKNVVFQWRSWDHFSILDSWHQNMHGSYIDYVHGNAIEIDNDSNIIISSRHLDEITKINRTTGDIIWRLGGKNNQFTFLGDTLKFTYQHAIRRISNGNITLFDNGNFHSPPFSRAVEYNLDTLNRTATAVWEYRHNPDVFANAMGYVQRLSNGNTLIGWGMANPTVTEVTQSGTIAFEMTFPPGVASYRAFKFNWNGPPVGINNSGNSLPAKFTLNQNYPNPFNPSTNIDYQIAQVTYVKLSVFDILGREIQILVNEKQNPGSYKVRWDADYFPSGIYFYKLQAGTFTQTNKMILIK